MTVLLNSFQAFCLKLICDRGGVVNGGIGLFTEKEHVVHQLLQLFHVSLHDVEEPQRVGVGGFIACALLSLVCSVHEMAFQELLQRTGNERERCAQLVRGIGKEARLLIVHLTHATVGAACHGHSPQRHAHSRYEEHNDKQEHQQQRALNVVEAEIGLKLSLYRGQIFVLVYQRVTTDGNVGHVGWCNDEALQDIVSLVGFVFQDVKG